MVKGQNVQDLWDTYQPNQYIIYFAYDNDPPNYQPNLPTYNHHQTMFIQTLWGGQFAFLYTP